MLLRMSEEQVSSNQISTSTEPVSVTRRSRRRRKRKKEPQISQKSLIAMVSCFTLVAICVAIRFSPQFKAQVSKFQISGAPRIAPEIWALGIAALVILYLIPGVEDRILRALGLRKETRPNRPRHGS